MLRSKNWRETTFGARIEPESTWGNYQDAAHRERCVMAAEFQAWIVKTKFDIEKRLYSIERELRELAPFAQAGIDNAASPQQIPMCVLQFADYSLKNIECQRMLHLLNMFFGRAAASNCEWAVQYEENERAEFCELWDWFIEDRNEAEEDSQKAGA